MKRYLLEYSKGLLQKTLFTLETDAVIGRGQDSAICLIDPDISRRHAEIRFRDGKCVLYDLGSRNGTFVNGERVESCVLKRGDLIRIGQSTMTFQEAEESSEADSLRETKMARPGDLSQEIQEQMDLVRTFLDALPLGVAIINDRMEVRYCNQALASLRTTGAQEGSGPLGLFLGCHMPQVGDFFCGTLSECEQCPLYAAAMRVFREETSTFDMEMAWQSKGEVSTPYVRFSLFPLPYRLTGESLAQLTWEDITSRKVAQDSLKKAHNGMEQRVKERTAELAKANRQLKREVEDRKRAQGSLRKSEEKYRALVENINEVIFTLDTQGRFTYVSPVIEQISGYKIDDLMDRPFTQFIHPDDLPELMAKFERVLSGQREQHEFRVLDKDASVLHIRSSSNILLEEGQPAGLTGIITDLTERKRAEEKVRETEERYRTMLEASPDPIVICNMEGKVVYFNPAFTRVFGWSLEQLSGKKMDRFVPKENRPETKMMVKRMLAGEPFFGMETRRYTREGNIIPVSMSGAVYRDQDGNAAGSITNLRDITEQKKLEGQLLQAQKMEAIGTLAGGMAHDFNNLLQAVRGYAELLLLDKGSNESGYSELQEILKASNRAGELVGQMLTFSRRVESKKRPLDLNHQAKQIKKLLERTIPKMIDIKLHLCDSLRIINADPAQMELVLMNLAINAKDAMPEGGKLIIETRNTALDEEYCRKQVGLQPGEYVLLVVSDTGHGMDQETMEHMFEPFYTTKGSGKGTGLGLAMVYGIIKSHDGHIMCHSELGKGTKFEIYLPVIEQENEFFAPEEQEQSPKGGTETILLVDDEPSIRKLGEKILRRFGYEVIMAPSGEEALEIYRREKDRIDLVILDLIMPGMGGKRCLEELLKIDPEAKLLIATGYATNGQTKEAIKKWTKGFIGKPFDIWQILQAVREALN